jgi:hypothetical protein
MKMLNEQQLETHIPIVAILMILTHALTLIAAVIVFGAMLMVGGFLGSVGVFSGDVEAARAMPFIGGGMVLLGTFIAAFLGLLSLPGVIAGIGLFKRKSWARFLAIVVAALGLLHFPIGTLVGIYTLIVLAQDAADNYFNKPQPNVEPQIQQPALAR